MTQKIINIGTSPNKGDGDPLRTAFSKINDNFTELYETDTATKYHLGDEEQFVNVELDGEGVPTGGITIQSGFNTTMPVYIKGGNALQDGVGGNVVIEAGAPPLATPAQLIEGAGPYAGTVGDIEMSANQTTIESLGNTWAFRNDGVLELPEGGDIVRDGVSVLGGGGDTGQWAFNGDTAYNSTGNGLYIQPGQGNADGSIYIPTTEEGGDLTISNNSGGTGAVTVSTNNKTWVFASDGTTGFPNNVIDGGLTSIDLKSSNYAELWYTAEPGTLPDFPNLNQDSYVWTDGEGVHIQNYRGADGNDGPIWNRVWQFNNDGKLQLPAGGDIVDSNGDSVLGGGGFTLPPNTTFDDFYEDGGATIYNSGGKIQLYSLVGEGNDGVNIRVKGDGGDSTWEFKSDGTMTFPDNELKTSVDNNLSIVTEYSPTEPPSIIEIVGADFTAVNLTYNKDGANSIWYPPGYIPGTDPYIEFTGGQYGIRVPGFGQALYVNTGTLNVPLAQWNTNPPLGSVAPVGVYTYPNTYTRTWTFGADGALTFPGGATVRDLPGETIDDSVLILGAGTTIDENVRAARIGINGSVEGVAIGAGSKDWSFTNDGRLTLPNDGIISAGGSGGLTLGGNYDVKIVSDYTDNNRTWTFNGTDGSVTFPDTTVQTTAWSGGRVVSAPGSSTGAAGDQQGDIAFTNSHLYYCKEDFVGHTSSVVIDSTEWGGTAGTLTSLPFLSVARVPEIGWTINANFNTGPATLTITGVAPLGDNRYQIDFNSVGEINVSNGNTGTLIDSDPVADIWVRSAWDETSW